MSKEKIYCPKDWKVLNMGKRLDYKKKAKATNYQGFEVLKVPNVK